MQFGQKLIQKLSILLCLCVTSQECCFHAKSQEIILTSSCYSEHKLHLPVIPRADSTELLSPFIIGCLHWVQIKRKQLPHVYQTCSIISKQGVAKITTICSEVLPQGHERLLSQSKKWSNTSWGYLRVVSKHRETGVLVISLGHFLCSEFE